MRVKLVKEVDVYWKVYVDEETGIYDIQGLYVDWGEFGDLGIGDNGDFYMNGSTTD